MELCRIQQETLYTKSTHAMFHVEIKVWLLNHKLEFFIHRFQQDVQTRAEIISQSTEKKYFDRKIIFFLN